MSNNNYHLNRPGFNPSSRATYEKFYPSTANFYTTMSVGRSLLLNPAQSSQNKSSKDPGLVEISKIILLHNEGNTVQYSIVFIPNLVWKVFQFGLHQIYNVTFITAYFDLDRWPLKTPWKSRRWPLFYRRNPLKWLKRDIFAENEKERRWIYVHFLWTLLNYIQHSNMYEWWSVHI